MEESQIKTLEQVGKAGSTTTYFSKEQGYVTSLDIREGDYVMEGGTVVRLADLNTLWAEAQVYTSQLIHAGGNAVSKLSLPGSLSQGVYVAEITDTNGNKQQVKLTIQ